MLQLSLEGGGDAAELRPGGNGDLRLCLGGDGVVLQAALGQDQAKLGVPGHLAQRAAQEHGGVAPAQADALAGVTAPQAADRQAPDAALVGLPPEGQDAVGPVAAGAAHGEDALALGVQVQELAALEVRGVQALGPQHADLLIGGDEDLQPGVGQTVVIQDGESHGHGDAVVPAQGGALGPDPVLIAAEVQALSRHVLSAAGDLLADHVQVALEDQGGGGLVAGGGLLHDDDVVVPVPAAGEAPGLGEVHAPVGHGAGIPGAVGEGAEGLKPVKNRLGFQMFQHSSVLSAGDRPRWFSTGVL